MLPHPPSLVLCVNRTYNLLWEKANGEIQDIVEIETSKDPAVAVGHDYESQRQHLSILYIRYVQIFRDLDEIYDQMTHPQKRRFSSASCSSCSSHLNEAL